MDERDDLNEAERTALRRWGSDWQVPDRVRDDTIGALARSRRQDSRALTTRRRIVTLSWAAAAAAIAFVAGLGVGGRPPATVDVPPQRYMLLLFEADAYRAPADAVEQRQRVGEYVAWARKIGAGGRYVDGEELATGGERFGLRGGALASLPAPPDPERGVLAGYFVVGAASRHEALALLPDCPHLAYGGTVEVRPIVMH